MATTLADLYLEMAYRLGMSGTPSDAAELARWRAWLNEAYLKLCGKHAWWFLETSGSLNSVSGQSSYGSVDGLPQNMRLIIELRVNDIPFKQIQTYQKTALDSNFNAVLPYNTTVGSRLFYLFAGTLNFVTALSSSTVNAITIKYFKNIVKLVNTSDVISFPDEYSYMLVDWCFVRKSSVDGLRGSAADGLAFFEEYRKELMAEHNKRRLFYQ